MNGPVGLRHVVRRVDPIELLAVPLPPGPSGTRDVVLDSSEQSPGDFATLRNLTLAGAAGSVVVPAGTYGAFTATGAARLVLGEPGAATPAVYNLQSLTLAGASKLKIAGPVVLNVAEGVTVHGIAGAPEQPAWLQLNVSADGLTVNGGGAFIGSVAAPSGTVIVNGTLIGHVAADRLIVNGGGNLNAER
jgi:hypothetical protein